MKATYKDRMIRRLMTQGIDRKTAETTAAEIIANDVATILRNAEIARANLAYSDTMKRQVTIPC